MKNKELEEFNKSTYKTDGDGNDLTVYECLNRKERRRLLKETRKKSKIKKSTKLPITKKNVSIIIKDAKRIDASVLKGNALSIEDTKHKVSKFSDLFANKRKRK